MAAKRPSIRPPGRCPRCSRRCRKPAGTNGGAPVLGASDALGGFGHVYVTARVNATRVVLPDLNYDGSTTTVGAGDKLFFPSPVIETAVGVFGGTRTGLFALDFLGSAQLL